MFNKILIANRGAKQPLAIAFHHDALRAVSDFRREVTVFNKILIANRGAKQPLAVASTMTPCAQCPISAAR